LNRAGDTAIPTLKVMEVTPLNWHKFPAGVVKADSTPQWVRQQTAIGGARGDDVDQATATLLTDQIPANGPNTQVDYSPRNEAQKATAMGTTLAVDITRKRGYLEPDDPYPTGGAAVPAAPVVASIAPTTAPATQLPLQVTITGTGFTPWSEVLTGGVNTPEPSGRYVSPTKMTVAIWAASPGTVSVAVEDHNLLSNTNVLFTVT
jgi:hypothetical protein